MLFSILKLFSSFVLFLSSRFFQTSPSLSLRYLKLSISKTNLILKNLWLNVCNTKLTIVIIFYVSISVAVLDSHYHCSFPGIVHLPAHKLCLLNSNVSFLTHPGNLFHTFHGFFLKKKTRKTLLSILSVQLYLVSLLSQATITVIQSQNMSVTLRVVLNIHILGILWLASGEDSALSLPWAWV